MVIPIVFLLCILFSPGTTVEKNKIINKEISLSNGSVEKTKNNLFKFQKVRDVGMNNELNDKKNETKLDNKKNKYPWTERKINYYIADERGQSYKQENSVKKKITQKKSTKEPLPITENDKKIMERKFLKNLNKENNSHKYKIKKNMSVNDKTNKLKTIDKNKKILTEIKNITITGNHKDIMKRVLLNTSELKIKNNNNEINQRIAKDKIDIKQNIKSKPQKPIREWFYKLGK
jgi:transposase